jgi:single-strand DNA-binding protein
MNVFTFTGNLGKDCRTANTSGTAVCNFTVAVKSGYGEKEQTLWIDCALWGKQAESKLPDYLKKGAQVAVSGEVGTREHEGKTYLTCRVASISLVGGKRDDVPTAAPSAPPAQQAPRQQNTRPAEFDNFDDDIPF